ncbi:MAG TPA: AbrB/MazE/SpoVT family DNA-binding domain-containing protein [Fimbriimonadaceae bacterium]|nr:AbrB/MazE/SpoVT family DNA-binding domain-containing protein [Fimbriimonadaceae bacterium]
MQNHYAVHVDNKGYVLIPIELRRAMGIEPKSLLILTQEGDELRLVPGEVVPKRKLRKVPREELAQALIDGAVTRRGLKDAREGIRELGLDPADFTPRS